MQEIILLQGDCRPKSTTTLMKKTTKLPKPALTLPQSLTQPQSSLPLTPKVQLRSSMFRHSIERSRRKPPRLRAACSPNMHAKLRHSQEVVLQKSTELIRATWLQLLPPKPLSRAVAHMVNLTCPLGASDSHSLTPKCLRATQKRKEVQQAACRQTVSPTNWNRVWKATQLLGAGVSLNRQCQTHLQCSRPGYCRHSRRPRQPL